MNTLFFDCYAGISGDMTVAAMLDLGVPFDHLQSELEKLCLPPGSYSLSLNRTERHGIPASLFEVAVHDHHTHRHYTDIFKLITESTLQNSVKETAVTIFRKLAEAEAIVHGVPFEEVHFHEVGAIDSIIDIVATAICLHCLNVTKVYAAALPLGSGFVETAHGRLAVPAPATLELMKGLTVHDECGAGERVTPTGAAIVAALADISASIPVMTIQKTGSGAGHKDFTDCPNILRLILGNRDSLKEQVHVVECNLDDSSPQVLGFTMEQLLAAGALDVWFTSIQMKKNRPGVMLSFLSPGNRLEQLCSIVLNETTAIGVRHYPVSRSKLARKIESHHTSFGAVNFKTVTGPSGETRSMPEYEDCRAIAREQKLPLQQVIWQLMKEKKESL